MNTKDIDNFNQEGWELRTFSKTKPPLFTACMSQVLRHNCWRANFGHPKKNRHLLQSSGSTETGFLKAALKPDTKNQNSTYYMLWIKCQTEQKEESQMNSVCWMDFHLKFHHSAIIYSLIRSFSHFIMPSSSRLFIQLILIFMKAKSSLYDTDSDLFN